MNIEQALCLGIDLVERGDFASAEYVYQQILTASPGHRIAKYLMSEVAGTINASLNGTPGQKKLLKDFKENRSHYFSVPDYNLNWAISNTIPIANFLDACPLNVVDVGARGGNLGEIENLKSFIRYIGFDADKTECARINDAPPPGFRDFKIYPYFIGDVVGPITFNIYNSAGESSVYSPNRDHIQRFNASFGVQSRVQVQSTTLNAGLREAQCDSVDLLKLDTQGSELAIIKSAKELCNSVLLIESEVEFTEIYEGQSLAGEFLTYMHSLGFEVLYLNRVFANRQAFQGPSRGQLIFSDILFAKSDKLLSEFPPEQVAKHLVLLCNYGHLDRAHAVWAKLSSVRKLVPDLNAYFKSFPEDMGRLSTMSRDKLLCWQLHLRQTNSLPYDSDRSWPFR
jgi:FkbM family methyltransferase